MTAKWLRYNFALDVTLDVSKCAFILTHRTWSIGKTHLEHPFPCYDCWPLVLRGCPFVPIANSVDSSAPLQCPCPMLFRFNIVSSEVSSLYCNHWLVEPKEVQPSLKQTWDEIWDQYESKTCPIFQLIQSAISGGHFMPEMSRCGEHFAAIKLKVSEILFTTCLPWTLLFR